MNRITKIFQPISTAPKNSVIKNQDITSKSQRLMLELGLIKSTNNGSYHILPLLQRSIDKIINIIDDHMQIINAQKMTFPILTSIDLWKKSGRLNSAATELMKVEDRHGKIQILSPTHEESITSLIGSISPITYRQFPLRLYQIGMKFRDELKPRFGLMRTKEFLMKDLYTFDVTKEKAEETYNEVNNIYDKLLKKLEVPFVKACGNAEMMGGSSSHEYHYPSNIGEDHIIYCDDCGYVTNEELNNTKICTNCGKSNLVCSNGIEIAHTFLLEDKYSKTLGANVLQPNNKTTPLLMGCYGIGVTRIVAASIESLSSENEIRWPSVIAPFRICLIPPKQGSKEEQLVNFWTEKLYIEFSSMNNLKNDIIVDDRISLTIGKRLFEAKRMGYPIIIVIGSKANDDVPKFEIYDSSKETEFILNYSELVNMIKDNK